MFTPNIPALFCFTRFILTHHHSVVQEPCLERKVQEDDLMSITEVPLGLDANEWHALHSTSKISQASSYI